MAVTDPNYRYAEQTFEADGVQFQYEIDFDGGYIHQSDVIAYSYIPDENNLVLNDYRVEALTFISESGTSATVQISPTVAAGRRVVIKRNTDKTGPLVSYINNSMLTKANLDLANKQAIFAIAEILDSLMDGQIKINGAVQQIIDTTQITQDVYNTVIQLLNESGIIGVKPLVWHFVSAGGTDFDLPGADLDAPSFFDVYVNRLGQEPTTDFTILVPADPGDPRTLRMTTPTAANDVVFVVLRGSAKPYDGGAPLTVEDKRIKMIEVSGSTYFVDQDSEFALLRSTGAANATITVKAISSLNTMKTGSYFSVSQRGTGPVTIAADPGVNLIIPAGCLAQTRALNCTLSLTCEDADTNSWIVSGDLAKA